MPTVRSPDRGGERSASAGETAPRKRAGTCVRIPAPSLVRASAPTAPRWVRLSSARSAPASARVPAAPVTSATKPTPQASCSYAGS